MEFEVIKTDLKDISDFRVLFLHENKFQFIHNKCHDYGWADVYLFSINGTRAGYGAIWGANERGSRDAIFEFYLTAPFRTFSNIIFTEFYTISGATLVECQSNDLFLTSMLYEYSNNIQAEAKLFEDHEQRYKSQEK